MFVFQTLIKWNLVNFRKNRRGHQGHMVKISCILFVVRVFHIMLFYASFIQMSRLGTLKILIIYWYILIYLKSEFQRCFLLKIFVKIVCVRDSLNVGHVAYSYRYADLYDRQTANTYIRGVYCRVWHVIYIYIYILSE